MLKSLWTKILGLRSVLTSAMLKLGKWKTGITLVAAWFAYFLIGRYIISVSADIVSTVMSVSVNVMSALLLSTPYLVGLGLLLATVLYIVDLWLKKKEG